MAISVLVLLVCLARSWAIRYRPLSWPRAAAWMSGVPAFFLALWLDVGPRDTALPAALYVALPPVATVLAAGGAWWLANAARRRVLEPYTAELADSPMQIPFPSRTGDGQLLRTRSDWLVLDGGVAWLDDVGPVEQFTHRPRTRDRARRPAAAARASATAAAPAEPRPPGVEHGHPGAEHGHPGAEHGHPGADPAGPRRRRPARAGCAEGTPRGDHHRAHGDRGQDQLSQVRKK